jgi:ATP-binding cassette subfamily F protein 3
LRALVNGEAAGAKIMEGVRVGYYSQDFAALNYDQTVLESLESVAVDGIDVQQIRATAANFLLTGEFMGHKVSHLSEGQKGLLAFARLVLMRPGLLILDEPTNHINFRHIPVIARAVNAYDGAIIMVSHMTDFVKEVRMDDELDLAKF